MFLVNRRDFRALVGKTSLIMQFRVQRALLLGVLIVVIYLGCSPFANGRIRPHPEILSNALKLWRYGEKEKAAASKADYFWQFRVSGLRSAGNAGTEKTMEML